MQEARQRPTKKAPEAQRTAPGEIQEQACSGLSSQGWALSLKKTEFSCESVNYGQRGEPEARGRDHKLLIDFIYAAAKFARRRRASGRRHAIAAAAHAQQQPARDCEVEHVPKDAVDECRGI